MSIKISNIFFSETTGPIQVRFYVENVCLTGTKIHIIGPGHMTKMAAMPIYGKNPLKVFFFRTISQMTLKLNRQQKELEPNKNYINDDLVLTFTYFMARSNLFPSVFEREKCIHPKELRFMK